MASQDHHALLEQHNDAMREAEMAETQCSKCFTPEEVAALLAAERERCALVALDPSKWRHLLHNRAINNAIAAVIREMDQQSAYEIVSEGVRKRLERAFWEVDDVVVALAPDAPPEVMDAWTALHKAMTPEFIARRDRLRGKP